MCSLYVHIVDRLNRIVYRARGELYREICKLDKKCQVVHAALSKTFPAYSYPSYPVPSDDIDLEGLLRGTREMSLSATQRGLGECVGSVRHLLDKRDEALTFSRFSTKTNTWRVGEVELRLDPAEKRLDAWHGSEKGW